MGYSRFAGAVKHPLWISIGTVVGVLGLVVAGIDYFRGQETSGGVEVASVSIASPEVIGATIAEPGLPRIEEPYDNFTATPIDVSLKNAGSDSFHITEITAEPRFSKRWQCDFRGGYSRISAEYSIVMPTNLQGDGSENESEAASTSVDYQVPPGSSERMLVTVGPDDERTTNYFYVVDLKLKSDSGVELVTPPLALIASPPESNEYYDQLASSDATTDGRTIECLTAYIETVEAQIPPDAIRSAELDSWISGLKKVAKI